MTGNTGTGISVLVIGVLLGLWSVTGAMQTLMWGLNVVYDREEMRGFVRKRLTALKMVGFAGLGVLLVFGLLVLGPQLINWVGDAVGQHTVVSRLWWTAQWPILIVGVLIAFAGMYYLGPNVEQPRWRVFTFGAGLRDGRLARALRALLVLCEQDRLVQQDLGCAGGGRDPAHLAVADCPGRSSWGPR